MNVLLHEGHEHTETAASTASTDLSIVLLIGVLLAAALLAYGVKRYAGDG